MPALILGLILLIVPVIIVGIALVLKIKAMTRQAEEYAQREQHIHNILNSLKSTCAEYQKRLNVVNLHATDYVNSLHAETSRTLLQLTNLLGYQYEITRKVEALLSSHGLRDLADAEKLLTGQMVPHEQSGQEGAGFDQRSTTQRWAFEDRAEELLQKSGQDVYDASEKAGNLALPKKKDRKPTALHLREIGIDIAERPDEPDEEEEQ
jgi:hypothetical protein